MKHFVYSMKGEDLPPAGDGTTSGWFYYYKWDVDGEAYMPFPENLATGEASPEPGDLLWFVMDGNLLGYVPLTEARHDQLNQRVEFCYDTNRIMALPLPPPPVQLRVDTGMVTTEEALGKLETWKLFIDRTVPRRTGT